MLKGTVVGPNSEGHWLQIPNQIVILSLKYVLTYSIDPGEMLHAHLGVTVCTSTHLYVRIQGVIWDLDPHSLAKNPGSTHAFRSH